MIKAAKGKQAPLSLLGLCLLAAQREQAGNGMRLPSPLPHGSALGEQAGRQTGRYSRQARKRQARVGRYVTARRIKYGLLTF